MLADVERKKTADALAARLEAWKTDRAHPPADAIAIGNEWTRELFDGDFYVSSSPESGLPSTSLVFVESREGNTVAKNPAELGGGETDKHLIYEGLSRAGADAVMAGAETIRDGKLILSVWHPQLVALRQSLGLSRHPIQIVATLRGVDFDNTLMFNVPDLRVILLTVPQWSAVMHHGLAPRPWITPVIMPRPTDLRWAFGQFAGLGIRRISCIGGRTLAGHLLDAGLIRDLYLTKSPRSGGQPNTPLYSKPLQGELVLRKRGTGVDSGVTFEHTRFS